MRDIGGTTKLFEALIPKDDTGGSAYNGTAIDRSGYQFGCFGVITGALTGTPDATTTVAKVQHCATSDGSYVDVSGATYTFSGSAVTNVIGEMGVNLGALNKYVRVTETTSFTGGSTPKLAIGSVCVLGNYSGTIPV